MGNGQSSYSVEQSDKIVMDVEPIYSRFSAHFIGATVSKMPDELIGIETQVKVGEWTVSMGEKKARTHFLGSSKEIYINTGRQRCQGSGVLSDWTKHHNEITDVIDKLNAMMQIENGCVRFGDQCKWMRAVTQTILTDDTR